MSRLSQAIQYHGTREQRFIRRPFKYVEVTSESREVSDSYPDRAVVHKVEAAFRTTIQVAAGERFHGQLEQRFEHARRQIVHEVFGEYVAPLHEAIHLIHNGEDDKAEIILRAILANFEAPAPYEEPTT
jgi:hypothetical protein